MRGVFRRGPFPAARGKLGKWERGSRRTIGWSRGAGKCSEAAAPRSSADGGGLLRRGGASAAMGGGGWAWGLRWGEVKPFPRLFWAGRGRNDELDGKMRTTAMLCRGGGVPEALGGGERVEELRHGERKLAAGSTRAETRQRWGLRGEPELRGSNGGGHGRGSGRARLGLLGPERKGGEGGWERMLRELKGEERAEGAGEMEKWRTARLGASTVLGVRAGRWRRVAKSRSFGEEPGAQCVADQWTGRCPRRSPAANGVVTARHRDGRWS